MYERKSRKRQNERMKKMGSKTKEMTITNLTDRVIGMWQRQCCGVLCLGCALGCSKNDAFCVATDEHIA